MRWYRHREKRRRYSCLSQKQNCRQKSIGYKKIPPFGGIFFVYHCYLIFFLKVFKSFGECHLRANLIIRVRIINTFYKNTKNIFEVTIAPCCCFSSNFLVWSLSTFNTESVYLIELTYHSSYKRTDVIAPCCKATK